MAILIPALSACVARMTTGERRLAERLESKLDADYLLWYDVPVGPRQSYPDFMVLHPAHGLLILEVKDWRLATIVRADKSTWDILPGGDPKTVRQPRRAGPPLRATGGGRTQTRPATGAARWPPPGQAAVSMELWGGVQPHHPQTIY